MPEVLQVIQHGELRGAEIFALDLSSALLREGSWRVSLLSLFGAEEGYAAAVAGAGLEMITAQRDGLPRGLDGRLIWKLRSMLENGRYAVVQANGAATLKYLVAVRRLIRSPWRLVYRAIGIGSFWRRGLGRRLAYRWMLAKPDLVVAVSHAVAGDLLASRVNPRRMVVIPNGVEPSRVRGEPGERERIRTVLRIAPSEPAVVYLGSLAHEKNLPALVAVVAACRQQGIAVKALIVGDGPARESLREDVRRRGLQDIVHLVPAQERVGPYLAAADLCVLPSITEGMPALLIEAGIAGVASVAYAVGGVPEVIEDGVTGVLVHRNHQDALMGAVAGLLRDGARRRAMGDAARARYRRFEIAAVARAYRDEYGALVEEHRAR